MRVETDVPELNRALNRPRDFCRGACVDIFRQGSVSWRRAGAELALSKKNLIGSYKRTRLSRLLCHKGKISVQKQKLVLVLD